MFHRSNFLSVLIVIGTGIKQHHRQLILTSFIVTQMQSGVKWSLKNSLRRTPQP
jgi:hypothetical protein